jgi:hypothetical protein
MPDPIAISADGTTASLSLDLITPYKLSLRGTTLDAGIEVVFEYADIGQTNWRPLFVGPEADDPRVKLNSKFQDILISGDCLLRAVITGYGTSNTVTLTAKALQEVTNERIETAVQEVLDMLGVLREGVEYEWTNSDNNASDLVTITRPI